MSTEFLIYGALGLGFASALVGGVFQSFSDFVMKGLALAGDGGAEGMRMLNRTVFRSVFLTTALGLGPLTIAYAVFAQAHLSPIPGALVLVGTVIYCVFVLGVTVVGNVPMNERLERLEIGNPQRAAYWGRYHVVWTRWNHLRTFGGAIAALCFLNASVLIAGA
ncbi:MAG: anthrone oxygenase family protein [Pseudomonadota bacterium]